MTRAEMLAPQIEDLGQRLGAAREMIRGVFIGQERVVDLVLITLLCGGQKQRQENKKQRRQQNWNLRHIRSSTNDQY